MPSYPLKKFYLFNCDNTYDLGIVETFLIEAGKKYGFQISVDRLCFGLQRMGEVCEKTLPKLAMDFAVFVIHADESRLSINEDNAGIGYARLYRALLHKTGDNVLIVIGGDKYYRDEDEKARFFISRWARRKVASQFLDEYLDGRQSFIFSWNEKHRLIHEEALRHFLDPSKRGFKFEYTPPAPTHPRQEPSILFQKNTEALVPRCRSFNDQRESPKRELTHDLEKGTYGGISSGSSGAPAVNIYPTGTVLLETYMHFGRISVKDNDVLQGQAGWRPTEKQESDLMEDWKSEPVAKVIFVSTGNGGVRYSVDKVAAGDWKERCLLFYRRCRPCCSWLWRNYKFCVAACFLGLVVFLGYWWIDGVFSSSEVDLKTNSTS